METAHVSVCMLGVRVLGRCGKNYEVCLPKGRMIMTSRM